MTGGFIDTNVFVHAQSRDEHSNECLAFLRALQRGDIEARLEPLVVHELTYVLPRLVPAMTRREVAHAILTILGWPGVVADRALLRNALHRWSAGNLAFVDAYLAAAAAASQVPVYTKNVRDFDGQGVEAPDPLPG